MIQTLRAVSDNQRPVPPAAQRKINLARGIMNRYISLPFFRRFSQGYDEGCWENDIWQTMASHPDTAGIVLEVEALGREAVLNEAYKTLAELAEFIQLRDGKQLEPLAADRDTALDQVLEMPPQIITDAPFQGKLHLNLLLRYTVGMASASTAADWDWDRAENGSNKFRQACIVMRAITLLKAVPVAGKPVLFPPPPVVARSADRLERIDTLLGSRVMNTYLQLGAARDRNWPEVIRKVVTELMDKTGLDRIMDEVDARPEAEILYKAEAAMRKLHVELGRGEAAADLDLLAFFALRTSGEFDLGEMLVRSFGVVTMYLDAAQKMARLKEKYLETTKERFELGYVMLRAAEILSAQL